MVKVAVGMSQPPSRNRHLLVGGLVPVVGSEKASSISAWESRLVPDTLGALLPAHRLTET